MILEVEGGHSTRMVAVSGFGSGSGSGTEDVDLFVDSEVDSWSDSEATRGRLVSGSSWEKSNGWIVSNEIKGESSCATAQVDDSGEPGKDESAETNPESIETRDGLSRSAWNSGDDVIGADDSRAESLMRKAQFPVDQRRFNGVEPQRFDEHSGDIFGFFK